MVSTRRSAFSIADDGPSASGAKGEVDETDFDDKHGNGNIGTISTSGQLGVDFGQDGPGRVATDGNFAASGSVANNVLSSAGVKVNVTSTDTGYVGTANGVTVFTLTLNAQNRRVHLHPVSERSTMPTLRIPMTSSA